MKTAYNALATGINAQYAKVAGGTGKAAQLLPLWDESDAEKDANNKGFDINTDGK